MNNKIEFLILKLVSQFMSRIKLFYYLCGIKTDKMKVKALHHHHFHTCNQAS